MTPDQIVDLGMQRTAPAPSLSTPLPEGPLVYLLYGHKEGGPIAYFVYMVENDTEGKIELYHIFTGRYESSVGAPPSLQMPPNNFREKYAVSAVKLRAFEEKTVSRKSLRATDAHDLRQHIALKEIVLLSKVHDVLRIPPEHVEDYPMALLSLARSDWVLLHLRDTCQQHFVEMLGRHDSTHNTNGLFIFPLRYGQEFAGVLAFLRGQKPARTDLAHLLAVVVFPSCGPLRMEPSEIKPVVQAALGNLVNWISRNRNACRIRDIVLNVNNPGGEQNCANLVDLHEKYWHSKEQGVYEHRNSLHQLQVGAH
jgi:hypothetical protein